MLSVVSIIPLPSTVLFCIHLPAKLTDFTQSMSLLILDGFFLPLAYSIYVSNSVIPAFCNWYAMLTAKLGETEITILYSLYILVSSSKPIIFFSFFIFPTLSGLLST